MVMRLVRDDDYGPMELDEELQPPRPNTAPADDDTDVAEAQDGAVETAEDVDTADDTATDDAAESVAAPADVPIPSLEALLFSTHHPLTAGRIAETLDLPTTKPIRKAIKHLNDA